MKAWETILKEKTIIPSMDVSWILFKVIRIPVSEYLYMYLVSTYQALN